MTSNQNPIDAVDEQTSACTNSAIRRAARRIGQIYDDALKTCDLRATQYGLLSQINREQGATMRTIADAMVMDLSALGHTLKPLVRDGLVELVVDIDDRRSKRVYLSPTGEEKLKEAQKIWRRVHDSFEHVYGDEDALRLRKTLDFIASSTFAEKVFAGLHD